MRVSNVVGHAETITDGTRVVRSANLSPVNEPSHENESTMSPHARDERNGVQWQNVGPALGAFTVSAVLAYAAGDGDGWPRVERALGTAAILLLVTMAVARSLARFLPIQHRLMNSIKVFIGIWAAVIA